MSLYRNRIIRVAYSNPDLREAAFDVLSNSRALNADSAYKRALGKGFIDVERMSEVLGKVSWTAVEDSLFMMLMQTKKGFIFDPNDRLSSSEISKLERQLRLSFEERFGIMDAGDYYNPKRVEADKLARNMKFKLQKVQGRAGSGYKVVTDKNFDQLMSS